MKIKIVLFDIDGVMIRPPYYFGSELKNRWYENADSVLQEFFTEKNKACTEWKTDVQEEVLPYLKRLGWNKTVEEFFDEQYAFESQYFDDTFTSIVKAIQRQDIYCYLATSQEYCRANFFLEEFGFNKLFNGSFISCRVWARKNVSEFWEYVMSDLEERFPDIKPEEIAFFDDQKAIVEQAAVSGIRSFQFTDMEQFYSDLENLGIKI